MGFNLIIFDMGDVVIQEGFVWNMIFREYNPQITNIRQIGPNSRKMIEKMLTSDTPEQDLWDAVKKDTGIRMGYDGFLYDKYECIEIPGTKQIITELLSKNKRVVCGTNNICPFYLKIKEKKHYDIFPRVYSSFKIGISKPNKEFWRYIAASEKITNLNEILFIDDNIQNIKAAKSIGIRTHHFHDAIELRTDLMALGLLK